MLNTLEGGAEERYFNHDEIIFDEQRILHLFLLFLLTSALVFAFGNLFINKSDAFTTTLPVFFACIGLSFSFLGITIFFRNPLIGILLWQVLMLGVTYCWRPLFVSTLVLWTIYGIYSPLKRLRITPSDLLWQLLVTSPAALLILACAGTPFDILDDMQSGSYHMDLPFHASIAAMIKNYGVASTGLHGLVATPYHVFSHALMASISVLARVPVIVVYGSAHWIFFVPFLFFAIAYSCMCLGRLSLTSAPKIWLLISCALFFIAQIQLPIALRDVVSKGFLAEDTATVFTQGLFFLGSESYVLSIGLFLLSTSLVLRSNLHIREVFLAICCSAALAWAKASTGVIFAALWLTRFLFARNTNKSWDLLTATCSAVTVTAVILQSVTSVANSGGLELEWLSHVRRYGHFGEQIIYGLFLPDGKTIDFRGLGYTLLALIIFAGQFFLIPTLAVLIISLTSKQSTSVHAVHVLTTFCFGSLIVLLFRFSEGNAFWFFNLASFASLPYVLVFLTQKSEELNCHPQLWRIARVCVVTACLLFSFWLYSVNSLPPVTPNNRTLATADWFKRLITIRDIAPHNIALKNSAFSSPEFPVPHCMTRPFVYPALTERPWLNLLSNTDDCFYHNYLFSAYGVNEKTPYATIKPVLLPGMAIVSPDHIGM